MPLFSIFLALYTVITSCPASNGFWDAETVAGVVLLSVSGEICERSFSLFKSVGSKTVAFTDSLVCSVSSSLASCTGSLLISSAAWDDTGSGQTSIEDVSDRAATTEDILFSLLNKSLTPLAPFSDVFLLLTFSCSFETVSKIISC